MRTSVVDDVYCVLLIPEKSHCERDLYCQKVDATIYSILIVCSSCSSVWSVASKCSSIPMAINGSSIITHLFYTRTDRRIGRRTKRVASSSATSTLPAWCRSCHGPLIICARPRTPIQKRATRLLHARRPVMTLMAALRAIKA